jgi:protein TonB
MHYLAALCFLVCTTSYGQSSETIIFADPQVLPKSPRGTDPLRTFIKRNLEWPTHVQGKVILEFCVNADGSLSDFKIVRGLDDKTNQKAIELFQKMPKWIPGTLQGKPVKTKMVFPIKFEY